MATETEMVDDDPKEVEEAVEADDDNEGEEQVEAAEHDDDAGEDDEQAEPELVEVTIGGQVYKVDPALKDNLMMREDYTRKTQEVAEARKAFEAEQRSYQERVKFERELGQEMATLRANEQRLEQFDQVDWAELQQQDPNMHAGLLAEYTKLQRQTALMQGHVGAKYQEMTFKQQQETAKRAEQVRSEIASRVPDWDKVEPEVKAYAKAKGVSERDLQTALNNDAYIAEIMADALFGYRVKNERKKPKPARPVEATPGPLPQVGGRASQKRVPSDRQSVSEWMKARDRQLRSA